MNLIKILNKYLKNKINKSTFIKEMYQQNHSMLFAYSEYLKKTNIASIEISDNEVIMTSRDKSIKMICPPGDHRVAPIETLNFFDYETNDSAMVMRLVSPNDCIFDIGANMGWYSINIARTFPSCKVYAFEPIKNTYAYLEKNIKINSVKNIIAYNIGLSNECKETTFYFYPEGSGNASSKNLSDRKDVELITCHTKKLDDFIATNKLDIDFIKCDIEGAELLAFQGGGGTIKKNLPIIFTEMLRKWAAKFNYHPNEIIDFFSKFGYLCFYSKKNKLVKIDRITDMTLETNFFFLHSKKHNNLIKKLS